MSTKTSRLQAITDDFIAAYNAKDFERLRALIADDFYFQHHNRNFEFTDRDAFLDTLKLFAGDIVPDRRFAPATRVVESGDVVVREHTWGGTAKADVPGMAQSGEKIALDLCSVFTFAGDRICAWHDYG